VTRAKAGYIGCMLYQYPLPFVAYYMEHHPEIEELILEETDRFWNYMEQDKPFFASRTKRDKMVELLTKTQHLVHMSHDIGG